MIGAVGDDAEGGEMLTSLAAAAVDTSCVATVVGASTGLAVISVGESGENTIVVAPGANSALTVSSAGASAVASADVLLAQLEVPQSVVTAAAKERLAGVPFLLNAAPAAVLTPELAGEVDILIVNEHEAAVIAASEELEEALSALVRQFPAVLVTLGERGSVLRRAGCDDVRVAAPTVSAVDTTAAGDTFCGVLAGSLAAGRSIEHAMRMATAASSLAVQRWGAQESVPTLEQTQAEAAAIFGTD